MNDDPQHICQPSKDYLALAEKSGTSEMIHANILRRIKFNFIYVFLRAQGETVLIRAAIHMIHKTLPASFAGLCFVFNIVIFSNACANVRNLVAMVLLAVKKILPGHGSMIPRVEMAFVP